MGDTATVMGECRVATLTSPEPVTWKSVPTPSVAKVTLDGSLDSAEALGGAAMKGKDVIVKATKNTPITTKNFDFFMLIPPEKF
jgi:hypothetical protein